MIESLPLPALIVTWAFVLLSRMKSPALSPFTMITPAASAPIWITSGSDASRFSLAAVLTSVPLLKEAADSWEPTLSMIAPPEPS